VLKAGCAADTAASGAYLLRYVQEATWCDDDRRSENDEQVDRLAALAMTRGKSVDFGGF